MDHYRKKKLRTSLREKYRYLEFFYLSIFSPNTGKYGPEKLRTWTIFNQCIAVYLATWKKNCNYFYTLLAFHTNAYKNKPGSEARMKLYFWGFLIILFQGNHLIYEFLELTGYILGHLPKFRRGLELVYGANI